MGADIVPLTFAPINNTGTREEGEPKDEGNDSVSGRLVVFFSMHCD